MTYHYDDIKTEWAYDGDGVLGYDIPILLTSEYGQGISLATAALNIGYHLGMMEAKRRQKERKKKNEH